MKKPNLVEAAAKLITERFGHLTESENPRYEEVHEVQDGGKVGVTKTGMRVMNGDVDENFTHHEIESMDNGGTIRRRSGPYVRLFNHPEDDHDHPEGLSVYGARDGHWSQHVLVPNYAKRPPGREAEQNTSFDDIWQKMSKK